MITPTDEQFGAIKAINKWFKSKYYEPFILGGYAGTGKSSLLPVIMDDLGLSFSDTRFCAYTGKAAMVLRKKGLLASTVHSLIYIPYEDKKGKLRFKLNPCLDSNIKLIIVDESSMIDSKLKRDLESYDIPVLYIGDHFQLPPINKDQVNLMTNPNYRLETIHRQAAGNPIIYVAHLVRQGYPIKYGVYGDSVKKTRFNSSIEEMMLKADQCLCGKNITRHNWNRNIRNKLGFISPYPEVNDKLICLKNNNENGLINGMIGRCMNFDEEDFCLTFQNDDNEIWNGLEIDRDIFDKQEKAEYNKDIEQFDFAYFITTHKAQGSQFDKVVLLEETLGRDEEMHRRWLYTAITRSIHRLLIIS